MLILSASAREKQRPDFFKKIIYCSPALKSRFFNLAVYHTIHYSISISEHFYLKYVYSYSLVAYLND